ncbi:MAG: hypothetical protein JXI33_04105 [Candidatus Aminicenantes bacterium]|nr:hypothetical protein [Candidatus Aminicenantes bacterium]
MIKKQQRWIALLVTLTFIWLLQVSKLPLNAAGNSEQVRAAHAEQEPDYFEAIAQKTAPAKKKSILPWILIGVGVLGVTAAVLFLVVLKKDYDITGAWNFVFTTGGGSVSYVKTFSGTKKSGTFLAAGNPVILQSIPTRVPPISIEEQFILVKIFCCIS